MILNKRLSHRNTELLDGFWKQKHELFRDVTIDAVYDRFAETGRISSLKADWKDGKPHRPHIFWESDVTKWVEGASYFLSHFPDTEIEKKIDLIAEDLEAAQRDDGYLNIYFTVVEMGQKFTRRTDHELYCAGHLIEAALAYFEATGKRKLLDVATRYVEHIDRIFRIEQSASFSTPGHQEIELALIKLYRHSKNKDHLALAQFFLDERGRSSKDPTYGFADQEHMQSHLPVRDQHTAEGHSVRALYLYSGMLDLVKETGDQELYETCLKLYENITNRRMAITGGLGSTPRGESFTFDYDLPEYTTYNETCASIALVFYCQRLWELDPQSHYADVAELALYNTVLSSVSLSGDHFFYENPLAVDPQRQAFNDSRPKGLKEHLPILERVKVFDCSCCPPNLLRIIGAIADNAYSVRDNTIYTHCYMSNRSELELDKQVIKLKQLTEYPYQGEISFEVETEAKFRLALRIPKWCESFKVVLNGEEIEVSAHEDGYVYIDRNWLSGDVFLLDLDLGIHFVEANSRVIDLAGRVAVMRGPLVYCLEGHDLEVRSLRNVRLDIQQDVSEESCIHPNAIDGTDLPFIQLSATYRIEEPQLYSRAMKEELETEVQLIPYHAWANRGISEMTTWFLKG